MPESMPAEPIPEADIIVLQGDDELAILNARGELERRCDSGGFGGMNSICLDGRTATRTEFAAALNTLPLGAPHRLVVLDHALECTRGKDGQNWLASALKGMPSSTVAVLVLPDSKRFKAGSMQWETAGGGHWLRRALKDSGKKTAWQEMPLPSAREMPDWIMREAAAQGVHFERGAAAELANLVGVDLYQARQEVSKARSYMGEDGTVTREVVRLLCSQTRQEDIFALVDALGGRDARKALGLLNVMLADQPAQYIFSMVARQVRLLLVAKEVSTEGGGERELTAASGVHPFVVRKLLEQCRRFSTYELEGLYRQLDELDEASKTGRASLDVGLEALVTRLARAS